MISVFRKKSQSERDTKLKQNQNWWKDEVKKIKSQNFIFQKN